MQQFSEDLASVVACCIEFKDDFSGYWTDEGIPVVRVQHRGDVFSIYPGEGDFLIASTSRLLSNVEDYPITESEPIVDVDYNEIQDIADGLGASNIKLDVETEMVESEALEFFDGYTTRAPLYLDSEFGLREFDTVLCEVNEVSRRAFQDTIDALGIDTDVENASGGDSGPDSGPAFQ